MEADMIMSWVLGAAAFACGGTFCDAPPDPTAPSTMRVDQTEERILFSVEDNGEVEVHVQVSYRGAASNFAWLVPVPGVPELETTSTALFDALEGPTRPSWNLTQRRDGVCKPPRQTRSKGDDTDTDVVDDDMDVVFDESSEPTVDVVSSDSVGPYDTVVLQATSAEDLIAWLQDNDFAVPNDATERMRPYVDAGAYIVALRLSNGSDAGDIVPLSFRYSSDSPQIPIQLTGVAADPDMRLHVWVLGAHRAVPESYLHVQVNPFAVNWWTNGADYDGVISRAADEAGGQGFATDAAMSTSVLDGSIARSMDLRPLQQGEVSADLVLTRAADLGMPVDVDTATVIRRHVAFPQGAADAGFDDLGWYSCLSQIQCASGWTDLIDALPLVDTEAFADDLQTDWLDVLQRNQDLVDRHAVVTRLRSSMGPDEMTVDPSFVLNPDMPMVAPDRHATLVTDCGNRRYRRAEAPRWLELEDGRRARLSPGEWGEGSVFVRDAVGAWAAEIIEQTGRTGAPTLISSNTDAIATALADLEAGQGCACDSRSTPRLAWLSLLFLPLLRRREVRA
jgi:hypothetical protein